MSWHFSFVSCINILTEHSTNWLHTWCNKSFAPNHHRKHTWQFTRSYAGMSSECSQAVPFHCSPFDCLPFHCSLFDCSQTTSSDFPLSRITVVSRIWNENANYFTYNYNLSNVSYLEDSPCNILVTLSNLLQKRSTSIMIQTSVYCLSIRVTQLILIHAQCNYGILINRTSAFIKPCLAKRIRIIVPTFNSWCRW